MSITLLNATQKMAHSASSIRDERAWLKRILFNACMDIHRYRKRSTHSDVQEESSATADSVSAFGEAAVSAEEFLLAQESSRELQERIQALPAGLRVPLVMRFYQDMSYPEIAEALKLTNCNVRKRIQLAYERLRTALPSGRGDTPSLGRRASPPGAAHGRRGRRPL